MNTLLINPIIRESEPPSFFPLGLGYIAQVLLDNNHRVTVLDINANRWGEEEITKRIENLTYDIVGITGMITEYNQVKFLASVVRYHNPETKIICGGALATTIPELLLSKTDVDIAVIGEGEVTIKEVVSALENSVSLKSVDGIYFKEKEEICQTKPRLQIEKLDSIPFPARSLFPMEVYISNLSKAYFEGSFRAINMITSRGCPYNCVYCFHGMWGHKFRYRSAVNIVNEIKHLVKDYNVNAIAFNDEVFVMKKERVYQLCSLLKEEGIHLNWVCTGRVNLMDRNLLEEMRSAGCKAIYYGVESGSQQILNAMNKNATVDQTKRAIKLTREARIDPKIYLMIGMIGETEKTIQETVNFCREVKVEGGFSITVPLIGTPLYSMAKELGKIKESESELIERMDTWGDHIIINLTDMSNEKLMELKKEAESQIALSLSIRLYNYYRVYGIKQLMGRSIRYILNKKRPRQAISKKF